MTANKKARLGCHVGTREPLNKITNTSKTLMEEFIFYPQCFKIENWSKIEKLREIGNCEVPLESENVINSKILKCK